MAVNQSRSMNKNLEAGLTDGVIKKVAPDRGGVDTDAYSTRAVKDALQQQYGADFYGNADAAVDRVRKLSEKPKPYNWDEPISLEPPKPLFP